MTLDRRKLISAAALIAAAGAAGSYFIFGGNDGHKTATVQQAQAASGDENDVNTPGPLEEMIMGDPNAPNTIIEYSSLTCPHCASFHRDTLPELKAKYIDTGKAKLVIREFPLDRAAWTAAVVARCLDKSKFFPFIEILFEQQSVWAGGERPIDGLFNIAKLTGMTREQFDACIGNQKLTDEVLAVRTRGSEKFNVESTPSFFINGKILRGQHSIEAFEKMMNL